MTIRTVRTSVEPVGLIQSSDVGKIEDMRQQMLADLLARILVNKSVDLADELEVEKTIREFYPGDSKLEIDRLVDICPDIARGLIAAEI